MKRKYKKALQDCFEPPAPQRKAQFLQQIQAEQSQDTATPLFFQRYPKWIRQYPNTPSLTRHRENRLRIPSKLQWLFQL